jgi:transmembrane 9 superfamily protein 3
MHLNCATLPHVMNLKCVLCTCALLLRVLQLAVEDHRWWWRSFLCGGSTAFFVLGYCLFYYHYR